MKSGELNQLSPLEIDRRKAELLNKEIGNLEGCDCEDCKNKGKIFYVTDSGCLVSKECKCMDTRRSLSAIKRSGLSSLLERYTFDTWQATNKWQQQALTMAKKYIQNPGGNWFMMTGNPGSGKTHLCTALCGGLMISGTRVQYMLWRDVATLAKAVVNNAEEYQRIVAPIKTVPTLYIDDLFKAGKDERGQAKVTQGDINLAFEIINYRYNDSRKLTIISSELSIGSILGLDEAVGSRIYERTKDFYIPLDGAKNWRMG